MKLNILLGKTDAMSSSFKAMIVDIAKFFKDKQGAFLGEKKTYDPREGTIDEPTKRSNVLVVSTVDEKLEWFKNNSLDYLNALFSQEATNSSGNAKAELIVEDVSWGSFSSLELLRLKNVLELQNFHAMIGFIPVRSDSEEWNTSSNDMYKGRSIMETPVLKSINRTTEKENYILKDPNVSKDSPSYTPTVATKTTAIELGDSTSQRFSGEWSHRQRANALKNRTTLIVAVVEALKRCNEVEVVKSDLDPERVLDYLFKI